MVQKDKVTIILVVFLSCIALILYAVSLRDGIDKIYSQWMPDVPEYYFNLTQASVYVLLSALVVYSRIGNSWVINVCYSWLGLVVLFLSLFLVGELSTVYLHCNDYSRVEYYTHNGERVRIGGCPVNSFCINRNYPVETGPDRAWWGFMLACCFNWVSAMVGLVFL